MAKQKRIEFETRLELDHYRALTDLMLGKVRTSFMYLSLLGVGIILYLLISPRFGADAKEVPSWLFFLTVVFLVMPFAMNMAIRRTYKRQKASVEKMRFSFGKDGFNIHGETFKSDVKWSQVLKLHFKKEYAFLFLNKSTAFVLPKENMEEGDFKRLANLAEGIDNLEVINAPAAGK